MPLEHDTGDARLRQTDRSLPIALLRAREAVMLPVRTMLAKSPLNEQKWRVLRVLEEDGAMEQTAIANAACLLLPSLTRILQTMESEGLLTRRSHPHDRRKTLAEITDKGKDLIARYAGESREIHAGLEAALGERKLETLLDLLDELRNLDLEPKR